MAKISDLRFGCQSSQQRQLWQRTGNRFGRGGADLDNCRLAVPVGHG
ncbi:hypothetical protein [Mesorhizobium sp. M4B.F.Ca.ET.169.01.1.1]|nr:hypothetical protein [Mesorhizobium sp. M4B.F.Ca.ET.169.01.1.1]